MLLPYKAETKYRSVRQKRSRESQMLLYLKDRLFVRIFRHQFIQKTDIKAKIGQAAFRENLEIPNKKISLANWHIVENKLLPHGV